VVGASGFIGAKLFFSLSRLRSDVFAVSREVESSWRLLHCPYGNRLPLDITVPQEVDDAVNRHRPRTIFNLSAYGSYERQSDARRIHQVNYNGTLNLLHALTETGCDAFVQAGTSSEYGLNCAAPAESAELQPNSDYAVSKVSVSYLLGYHGRTKHFPCTHLRLYSVYGPWEERDRLISSVVRFGLQGNYPPLVNPAISRDFLYVDDCTRAFVRAALTTCRQAPGRIFNIATGVKTTIGDVANHSRELFGIVTPPIFGAMPERKWDLADWYGDPARARTELDWSSRVSFRDGLASGLRDAGSPLAHQYVCVSRIPHSARQCAAIFGNVGWPAAGCSSTAIA
jgi:dolichol-phosphate mannosyltransferase